jgi:hypothetical protein
MGVDRGYNRRRGEPDAYSDLVVLIVGDGYRQNFGRAAVFSRQAQYLGAGKRDKFIVLMTAGDRVKADSMALVSKQQRGNEKT